MPPTTPRQEPRQRNPGRTMVVVLPLLGLLLAYTCDLLLNMLEALSGFVQASALDLSQNGVGHLGIPSQRFPTQSCLHPIGGASWGMWEWTFLKHQHSPSVPQITMLAT